MELSRVIKGYIIRKSKNLIYAISDFADLNNDVLYKILIIFSFGLLPASINAEIKDKNFTVVIDAGHGGHDSGALGRKGREKNINLSVALKLGKLIENNCKDTKVVYTRTTDKFVQLKDRADIANKAKANLFISIHTNSLAKRNQTVRGAETYTLGLHRTQENLEVAKKENAVILIEDNYKQRYAGFNPKSSESYIIFEFMQDKNMVQSVDFATNVQRQFKNSRRPDRGVHQAGFLVLRETSMPSVLIELGYISNDTEEAYLISDAGSTELANAIYKAFLNYKGAGNVNLTSSSAAKEETGRREVKSEAIQKTDDTEKTTVKENELIFKIQIFASDRVIPSNSRLLKGLSPVSYYKEKGMIKYTYGEDTDYNKILNLKRRKVDSKFKDAFIIAFKNGEKININTAIKEFKSKR